MYNNMHCDKDPPHASTLLIVLPIGFNVAVNKERHKLTDADAKSSCTTAIPLISAASKHSQHHIGKNKQPDTYRGTRNPALVVDIALAS
ncbi:hypothetical protein JR316_0008568 [Psilocybe cubensis]|nr:hypothetical protein JR316_0008568 [Psilocybe cubensis]KAH9479971.1 hypothetical protein JR316_0008568 [Psilocybe cubensis]